MKIQIKITHVKHNLIDAYAGGFVVCDPKNLYFVDKKCKIPAEAEFFFDQESSFCAAFWYENENTLLKDLRYQMSWFTQIADYPRSIGVYSLYNSHTEAIKEFFDRNFEKISMNRADHISQFLIYNQYHEFNDLTFTKPTKNFFEAFLNYEEADNQYDFKGNFAKSEYGFMVNVEQIDRLQLCLAW